MGRGKVKWMRQPKGNSGFCQFLGNWNLNEIEYLDLDFNWNLVLDLRKL